KRARRQLGLIQRPAHEFQSARIASDAHVAGLTTGKAGILHLHLGDGARGLEFVRRALDETELPPRTFNPTHVNRRRALFDEAIDLAGRGSVVDITAFPVEEGEDAWSAEDALTRYLDSGAPRGNVTVSSDGGGCLPVFDEQGELVSMDIGAPGNLSAALTALLDAGAALEDVLPAFTENVARLLRLHDRGRVIINGAADFIVLDENNRVHDVMLGGRWHVKAGEAVVLGSFDKATQ
ncbi:MAG: hypothetical protein AAFX10_06300, partial [Pseudomonadota bacterium]